MCECPLIRPPSPPIRAQRCSWMRRNRGASSLSLTEMIATAAATIEQRWEQGTRAHLFSSAVEIAVAEGRLDDAAMKSSSASLTKVGWAGRGKP